MRAITLRDPHAQLMAAGLKWLETRDGTFRTNHRGLTAIHSSLKFTMDERVLSISREFSVPLASVGAASHVDWPRGAVIAVGELVDVWVVREFLYDTASMYNIDSRTKRKTVTDLSQLTFGNFVVGRHILEFRNLRRIETPVYCKGMLGVWTLHDNDARQVMSQL